MSRKSPSTDHIQVARELECPTANEQMTPNVLEDSTEKSSNSGELDYSEEIEKYRQDGITNTDIANRNFYTEI